jgi:hypothetical protein
MLSSEMSCGPPESRAHLRKDMTWLRKNDWLPWLPRFAQCAQGQWLSRSWRRTRTTARWSFALTCAPSAGIVEPTAWTAAKADGRFYSNGSDQFRLIRCAQAVADPGLSQDIMRGVPGRPRFSAAATQDLRRRSSTAPRGFRAIDAKDNRRARQASAREPQRAYFLHATFCNSFAVSGRRGCGT